MSVSILDTMIGETGAEAAVARGRELLEDFPDRPTICINRGTLEILCNSVAILARRCRELVFERDEWSQKWLADHGECKALRKKVEFLKPFQDAYDTICGEDLVLEQQERAQKAEAEVERLQKELDRLKEKWSGKVPREIL